jgi:TonB family protein
VEKAMPVRADKSAKTAPDKSKSAPSTSDAKSKSDSKSTTAAADAQQGTTGKPGKAGTLNGDTLSVGGGQGVPSAMGLWLSRVKYLVERNWRAPPGLAGVKEMPEVVFSVALDGRPSMAKMRQRSGNPTLDRLALRAVQSVDLFPPVPSAWPEDKVVLRYVLQYAP